MIKEFWVENYLSIRDRQTLSFVARNPESEWVAKVDDDVCVYKLAVFYGPNASGRSNILWAMNECFRLLMMPRVSPDEKVPGWFPFAETKDRPTKMGATFYIDGIRYDYEVTFNSRDFLYEKMIYYPKGSKSLFYERRYSGEGLLSDIKFGVSLHLLAKTQENIRQNTLNNHSVLSVCLKNTYREDFLPLVNLHDKLMGRFHEVDGDYYRKDSVLEILKKASADPRAHKFFSAMLREADLNITDFRPTVERRYIPEAYREHVYRDELADNVRKDLLRPTEESVMIQSKSENGTFEVPFKLQSKGTLTYIKVLDKLYDLITGNHVYFLDELGENLHSELLFYCLSVFMHYSDHSQLFITSHDTALLTQDAINDNRGVAWVVEKNPKTASSEYHRGDSFGLHKNLTLYNSYKAGRMGARPQIGSVEIDF